MQYKTSQKMSSIFDSEESIFAIRDLLNSLNDSPNATTIGNISDRLLQYAAILKEQSDARIKDIRENGPSLQISDKSYILGLLRDDEFLRVKFFSCPNGRKIEVTQPTRYTSRVNPAWETHYISGFDVWISEEESKIIMKKLAEF